MRWPDVLTQQRHDNINIHWHAECKWQSLLCGKRSPVAGTTHLQSQFFFGSDFTYKMQKHLKVTLRVSSFNPICSSGGDLDK